METKSSAPVGSTDVSSASTEKLTNNDATASMPEDFKQDFFKHKERMKQAESRAKELEERLKEIELTEEQKKGNYSKVIDELKESKKTLEKQLKSKDLVYAESNIKSALKDYAKEAGCADTETLVNLLAMENKLDIIALDDNYNPDPEDIKMIVEESKKKYDKIKLFTSGVNVVDGVPNNKPIYAPAKSIDKMNKDELEDQLHKLYGQ